MNTQSAAVGAATIRQTGPLIALGFLALLWGYNWVVMKIALRYSGPLDFAALRAAFGVLLLFITMGVLRVPLAARHIGKTALLGIFQTTGFVGLISWSLSVGDAGKSAVLAYTMPFWVIVFGWPFLDERLRGWQWPAVLLALSGARVRARALGQHGWPFEQLARARRRCIVGGQRHHLQKAFPCTRAAICCRSRPGRCFTARCRWLLPPCS